MTGNLTLSMVAISDGARAQELASPVDCSDRYLFYDRLQRMTGTEHWSDCTPQAVWVEAPTGCNYDPEGQLARPCETGAPLLAFDGANPAAVLLAIGGMVQPDASDVP